MDYEIWDLASGNVVATYDSESKAVLALSQFFSKHGGDVLTDYALLSVDRLGIVTSIAQGRGEIVRLIERRGTVSV